MFTGLMHLHSLLRWIVLILLIFSVVKAYMGKSNGEIYSDGIRKLNVYTVLGFHIQLVIGFIMYFMSDLVQMAMKTEGFMKIANFRYWILEHPFGMLIAVVLVTIGRAKAKRKESDLEKHKVIFTYFLIALIILIATIPWPFREIGRPFFSF